MENIKLILTDIDGTLLDSNKNCPLENIEAIKLARKQGIIYGFASGRPALNMLPMIDKWGLTNEVDVIMGSNGGEIYYVKEERLEKVCSLSPSRMIEFESKTRDLDVSTCFYEGMTLNTNKLTDTYIMRCEEMDFNQRVIDYATYIQTDYPKMLVINPRGKQEEVLESLKALKIDNLNYVPSSPILIEVIDKHLSKAKGIEEMMQHYHLEHDQILCFGDADNDYEMLKAFNGVAMANASIKTMSVAKYKTVSNDEAGVGKFIKENIIK